LGIDPPKGVLLHGPPGCGKTLIARGGGHDATPRIFNLNRADVKHQWYGSSEAHLRRIFEDARRRAPAIIFLDEIDAIAPKREEMSGERQAERRLVAQLLALMDGLESRGNVVVIAATNIPNTLDPALRRPGRFDREITISVPDKEGRREILDIYTRGMPLSHDVDLERLAGVTHGFVGADLESLGREAAMSALRRLMPAIEFSQARIPYDRLAALEVTTEDFQAALNEVEPSALREVFTEVPDVGWDDVGGLDDVKRVLIESVEWPLRHGPLFERAGIRPSRGILLHGPPGTGKTLLAKALARQSEANFISVKGPQLLSMYLGESERAVREVFRKARQSAPCIIFFDEIDALAPIRSGHELQTSGNERVVGQLLTELDGIEDLQGVVALAATNRSDRVDPALLRAGRFDVLVELPLPDSTARRAILAIHTRRMPLAGDVDLAALAEATEDFSGADIEGLCRRAALLSMREIVERVEGVQDEPTEQDLADLQIGGQHFDRALRELVVQR
jgi:transitional endoplasmic reticulum ATPase